MFGRRDSAAELRRPSWVFGILVAIVVGIGLALYTWHDKHPPARGLLAAIAIGTGFLLARGWRAYLPLRAIGGDRLAADAPRSDRVRRALVVGGKLLPIALAASFATLYGADRVIGWHELRAEAIEVQEIPGDSSTMRLMDVNDDGLVDLVEPYWGAVRLQRSPRVFDDGAEVTSWDGPLQAVSPNEHQSGNAIADVDGDGMLDHISLRVVTEESSEPSAGAVDPATGASPTPSGATTDPAAAGSAAIPGGVVDPAASTASATDPRVQGVVSVPADAVPPPVAVVRPKRAAPPGRWLVVRRGRGDGSWGAPRVLRVELPNGSIVRDLDRWPASAGGKPSRLVGAGTDEHGRLTYLAIWRTVEFDSHGTPARHKLTMSLLLPVRRDTFRLGARSTRRWIDDFGSHGEDVTGDGVGDFGVVWRTRRGVLDGTSGEERRIPVRGWLFDVAGDDAADIVDVDDHQLMVRRNLGDGRFGPARRATDDALPGTIAWVHGGDLNDDGRLDLVVTTYPRPRTDKDGMLTGGIRYVVLLGTGRGTFHVHGPHLRTTGSLQDVRDVDGDGHDDLVFTLDFVRISIAWGDGTGRFD
jgi:hypothetical protein